MYLVLVTYGVSADSVSSIHLEMLASMALLCFVDDDHQFSSDPEYAGKCEPLCFSGHIKFTVWNFVVQARNHTSSHIFLTVLGLLSRTLD